MGRENVIMRITEAVGNVFGACGLLGNLVKESGLRSTNLQDSFEKIWNITDLEYVSRVDQGKIAADTFAHDGGGFGLAQWTYWKRKEALKKYADKVGKSIGDEDMQIDFLIKELQTDYSHVWKKLCNAEEIKEASDAVLFSYEQPADQSYREQQERAKYGQQIYEEFFYCKSCGVEVMRSRQKVVDLITSWEGKKESDGSYKTIIDIYNSYGSKLPRNGLKMLYSWPWCACTWSALAIKLGYTDIMPIEMSCAELIDRAKAKGCWQENDGYIPMPADAVLYDWDDGSGYASYDNIGVPDHIGTVIEVNRDTKKFVVMEGNYNDAVKRRTMSFNGKYIRGFITPKYTDNLVVKPTIKIESIEEVKKTTYQIAKEVIAGSWGTKEVRKKRLEQAGYNYQEVQAEVNRILNVDSIKEVEKSETHLVSAVDYAEGFDQKLAGEYTVTEDLYLRFGAGKDHKAMVVLKKGTHVYDFGFYTPVGGTKWLYVSTAAINGKSYTGFCSSKYLKKTK